MPFSSPHSSRHPIVPPPELVQQWYDEARDVLLSTLKIVNLVATRAAQWGAAQEMDASSDWLVLNGYGEAASRLRAARRPKPPNLKQQALCALIDGIARGGNDPSDIDTIRRALEQLPE